MPDLPSELPIAIPEDFKEFWIEAVEEANACPLDYSRSRQAEFTLPGFLIELIEFRNSEGRRFHGWVAYQAGAFQDPGFLWLAPYGRESMLPNQYGTRHGFVSLSFNFHGHPAFHQEKYEPARGYFAEGADSPETWIFRRMFKDSIIAARILADLPETNEKRLASMGMSQGGGMSVWLGAWCDLIRAVCADMPFLGNLNETLDRKVYRFPTRELIEFMNSLPLGRERIGNTAAYYDTVHHAHFCKKPTQVSLGLKDPAATPENVRMIFDELSGEKNLIAYEIGHDWTPLMVESNREWLIENLT
jgi:cephalosporin-C deacetylase